MCFSFSHLTFPLSSHPLFWPIPTPLVLAQMDVLLSVLGVFFSLIFCEDFFRWKHRKTSGGVTGFCWSQLSRTGRNNKVIHSTESSPPPLLIDWSGDYSFLFLSENGPASVTHRWDPAITSSFLWKTGSLDSSAINRVPSSEEIKYICTFYINCLRNITCRTFLKVIISMEPI